MLDQRKNALADRREPGHNQAAGDRQVDGDLLLIGVEPLEWFNVTCHIYISSCANRFLRRRGV